MSKVALVTGASSGVGRATAITLATAGWQVTLIARRAEALAKTIELAPPDARPRMHPAPCDIADESAVVAAVKNLLAKFNRIDARVNAAGTNTPDRALVTMTTEK